MKAADMEDRKAQTAEKIIAATCDVFTTMVGTESIPGPPRTQPLKTFRQSVSGMLGLSGDFRAMVAVHCPDPVALAITESLLGASAQEIDAEVRDAVAEVTNMVAGGMKVRFGEEGRNLELSVPTTVAGSTYELNCLSRAECVIVPFTLGESEFLVEFKYLANA